MDSKTMLILLTIVVCISTSSFALDPTDDTYVDEWNPTGINGTSNRMITRSMYLGGFVLDTLIKFDLTWIPPDATVKSATLAMFYSNWLSCDPVGRQLDAFRITEDWDEDTANWNNRPAHNATPVATDYVPSVHSGMGWDVTSSVQDYVDGAYPNYGWKIRDVETSGNCMTYFFSKENGSDFDPGLVVDLDIIFVDAHATGMNHGSNWTDAYTKLQDALSVAVSGDRIWVAAGTYKPDQGGGQTVNDRTATFQLKNGVKLYGGFTGGETSVEQRNWKTNGTILSGDIGAINNNADNSHHIVTGTGTNSTAVLDGFTITAGNANATPLHTYGGGMRTSNGSPTVANCTFEDNNASQGGGGMFNFRNSSKIVNCTFRGNSSNYGGGIWNDEHGDPEFTNCLLYDNTANYGGGIYNFIISNPTLINCTLGGNTATSQGGGIFNDVMVAPTLGNCILWGNSDGGGTDATAQIHGGAAMVTYSCIQDDDPDDGSIPYGGAANHNIDDDPLFQSVGSGNLRLSGNSPCIEAGNNSVVPSDAADLDGDSITAEQTPLDLDLRNRFADGDCDGMATVDMGAYELIWVYLGDLDGDCDVDLGDLAIMANHWLEGK
jgi:hypothetical protein